MPTSSGAHRVRSAAFASSAVGLTLGAHATGGGELPYLPVLLLLIALVDAASATFARRPRGALATTAALLASQVGLHGAFALASPAHVGHVGHVPSAPMLVAHGTAAFVLAVLLSRGEQVITRVARVLLPIAVLRPFRPEPVLHPAVLAPADAPVLRLTASLHDLSRRGPPLRHLAART